MGKTITSIWQRPEFEMYQEDWKKRLDELKNRGAYYDGSVYRQLQTLLGPLFKQLYRGIKPLFLPFARAVDLDAGLMPGGWLLPESASVQQRAAVERVFRASAWESKGMLYVHYGAQMGITGLKIVDDRDAQKITISPVDPRKFMLFYYGPYGDLPVMSMYVERRGENGGFEYAEVITPDWIRTFADGEPTGFGDRRPEYRNDLGLVPYVSALHLDDGSRWGACTYERAIPMLDEVNELASYLADLVAKHVEPQWAVTGAEPSNLEKSGTNVWFGPEGAEFKALVAQLDINGVLQFIKTVSENVNDALPELSFTELRKRERIATATLEMQMLELTVKIQRCRPNYDRGLEQALRIAGLAAQQMGLANLTPLADEDLKLDNERRVLPLDPETRLRMESLALTVEAQRQGLDMQSALMKAGKHAD